MGMERNPSNMSVRSSDKPLSMKRDSKSYGADRASDDKTSNRSAKSSKSMRSNVSKRSTRRRFGHKTPEPTFKSIPLKRKSEDPDDPLTAKLEELRVEMQKKELLRKIDA